MIETNIDDSSPEIFPYVTERLFEAGAADVWLTPVVMKKGRLATKLSVLISAEKKDEAAAIILKETSSIGLRFSQVDKIEAERKVVKVETDFGEVEVKLAYYEGELVNIAPEYEDCAALAKKKKVPLKKVYQQAEAEGWRRKEGSRAARRRPI